MTEKSKKRKFVNTRKYAFEFLSIFIAVIAAFALNNWNDNRKDNIAESKILSEIYYGLDLDLKDVEVNMIGHKFGLRACDFYREIVTNQYEGTMDSFFIWHHSLNRDFTSIQNTSGYETLKSRGFELIKNDSLRSKIISLYESDYQSLRKIEEEYYALQFYENYFQDMNDMLSPFYQFDSIGNFTLKTPLTLAENDQKKFLSYLYEITSNRKFVMRFYDQVKSNIIELKDNIEKEM